MPAVSPERGASVVEVVDASREHRSGQVRVAALDTVSLTVSAGEAVAVVGRSGAGKTTLLNLIGGLDRPTSGRVTVLGQDLGRLSERGLNRFRASSVGLVFQDSYLLPGLSALENVMAANAVRANRRHLAEEAAALLDAVGLSSRKAFPPSRLSGGERQRVGIARAMLGRRPLLVADEPTGNLDAQATSELLDLFDELRETRHVALVIATHDPLVALRVPRCLRLHEGRMKS
jgi:ABC-type lipoprotein export system ATPase subunit